MGGEWWRRRRFSTVRKNSPLRGVDFPPSNLCIHIVSRIMGSLLTFRTAPWMSYYLGNHQRFSSAYRRAAFENLTRIQFLLAQTLLLQACLSRRISTSHCHSVGARKRRVQKRVGQKHSLPKNTAFSTIPARSQVPSLQVPTRSLSWTKPKHPLGKEADYRRNSKLGQRLL